MTVIQNDLISFTAYLDDEDEEKLLKEFGINFDVDNYVI